MVRMRSKGMLYAGPPVYHPESSSLTLAIYYGGRAVRDYYEGGKVRKVDYVDLDKLKFDQLEEFVQELVPCDHVKRFSTAIKGGFKLLQTDAELKKYGKPYLKDVREYPIIFDSIPPDDSEDLNRSEGSESNGRDNEITQNDNEITQNENENVNKNNEPTVGRKEMESSIEFLCRAEATEEWVNEYNRRYGGEIGASSVNEDACADLGDDVPENVVECSDESDSDYCDGSDVILSDDDLLFEDNVLNDVETEYVVEKDPSYDDVVFMNFDVGYDSSADSDYAPNGDHDSCRDNSEFDDNVSTSVELGPSNEEEDNESEEEEFFMDDVVGNEANDLNMRRDSDALFCPQLPESSQRIRDKLFEKSKQDETGPSIVQYDTDEEIDNYHDLGEAVPDILPPNPVTQEASEAIPQSQVDHGPTYNYMDQPVSTGPTMYDQLNMGNKGQETSKKRPIIGVTEIRETLMSDLNKKKGKAKKNAGVKLRVPPKLPEADFNLSQSSICGPMQEKHIIVEGGRKFLSLGSPEKSVIT